MIKTRSGANQAHTSDINVIRTAQLVPVISALVDKAIQSQAAKQELDSGVDEAKERTKEAREAHRMENERFDRLKEQDPKVGATSCKICSLLTCAARQNQDGSPQTNRSRYR